MFIKGIPIGLNDLIPLHGHLCPIKISGDRDEWKNAQKKDKKKKISEVINSIIPSLSPFKTSFVCIPSKVDSRMMSRHQLNETKDNNTRLTKNIILFGLFIKILTVKIIVLKSWKDARMGQGLRVTR